jgi:hypothetical protein
LSAEDLFNSDHVRLPLGDGCGQLVVNLLEALWQGLGLAEPDSSEGATGQLCAAA